MNTFIFTKSYDTNQQAIDYIDAITVCAPLIKNNWGKFTPDKADFCLVGNEIIDISLNDLFVIINTNK